MKGGKQGEPTQRAKREITWTVAMTSQTDTNKSFARTFVSKVIW